MNCRVDAEQSGSPSTMSPVHRAGLVAVEQDGELFFGLRFGASLSLGSDAAYDDTLS